VPLEGSGGVLANALVGQERHGGVEFQARREWSEWNLVPSRHGCRASKRCEVDGGRSVVAFVQAAHEIDDISAPTAAGEAVPEILVAGHDEGGGGVASMDGTRADQVVAMQPHGLEEPPYFEDAFDGHAGFEEPKIQASSVSHALVVRPRGRVSLGTAKTSRMTST